MRRSIACGKQISDLLIDKVRIAETFFPATPLTIFPENLLQQEGNAENGLFENQRP